MIAVLRSLFSFPLLAKELTERAARPRTYWMRIAAALLLYGGFWFYNDDVFKRGSGTSIHVLGSGEEMFISTLIFLMVCIYAFVPAMLCGVVTQEKERDSLVLLLLTRMRPWQIVVQKYFGGLIPAMTILFLALPLIAVAFAYGGLTTEQVYIAVPILILAILQIGAIALWASCTARTTVSAFLISYFVGAAVLALPAGIVEIDKELDLDAIESSSRGYFYAHVPPCVLIDAMEAVRPFKTPGIWTASALIAATTLTFLAAAMIQLPRRAFSQPRHWLRRFFATIDRWAHRINRWIGNVTFGGGRNELPTDRPIVWREKRSRALARPEYLVRLLMAVMIPVVLLGVAFVNGHGDQDELSGAAGILAGLATLVICTTAANGIVNERVNQTFEVLLTTPMTAASILRQKVEALRPLLIVLAVPILAVCGIELILEWDRYPTWRPRRDPEWLYPAVVLLTLGIYLPMFTWVSVWMGLWCKTRIRAIVTALVVIVFWGVAPIIAVEELMEGEFSRGWRRYLLPLSPATIPILNENANISYIDSDVPLAPVILNFLLYAGILYAVRGHCLSKADWYLRR